MMKTHLLAVGVTLIVGASVACYAADADTPKTVIAEVGELGENIYDLAKDKDWAKVGEKLTSIKKEAELLKSQVKEANEAKKQLSKSIAALEKAVGVKDRQITMQEANQITLIAANLTEPLHPEVPLDIARLDYYGRELELWSAVKDEAKLKKAADALGKTWDKVRPSVKKHGGTAEVTTFDGLMLKLKAAKSPKQYKSVAAPILDEVDNLEKVFERHPLPTPKTTGTKTSFKGWELYIWQDDDETYFSLLLGTNRLKTDDEIAKAAVKGSDAIKSKLDELKPGEYVSVGGKKLTEPPPKDQAASVVEYGRKAGLKMQRQLP
jgi:hypothetical protein